MVQSAKYSTTKYWLGSGDKRALAEFTARQWFGDEVVDALPRVTRSKGAGNFKHYIVVTKVEEGGWNHARQRVERRRGHILTVDLVDRYGQRLATSNMLFKEQQAKIKEASEIIAALKRRKLQDARYRVKALRSALALSVNQISTRVIREMIADQFAKRRTITTAEMAEIGERIA